VPTPTPDPTVVATPTPEPSPTATASPTPTATPTGQPEGLGAIGGGRSDPGAPSDPGGPSTTDAPGQDGLGRILTVTSQALDSVVSGVATYVGATVKPAAVAAVATGFGFPIALMIAVLAFLLIQHRLDARDPKLRAAPQSVGDSMLDFADEDDA
jgi:hypothetical protein